MANHTDPVCGMKVDDQKAAAQSPVRAAKPSLSKIRSNTRVNRFGALHSLLAFVLPVNENSQSMTTKLQSKNDECPLCGSNAIYQNCPDDLTRRVYECPKCGTYEITEESRSDVEGMTENPLALEAYRKRIKADNENKVATVIERESKKTIQNHISGLP